MDVRPPRRRVAGEIEHVPVPVIATYAFDLGTDGSWVRLRFTLNTGAEVKALLAEHAVGEFIQRLGDALRGVQQYRPEPDRLQGTEAND